MAMPPERIYLSPPDMSEADLAALTEAFRSNWIAPVGPALDAFESEMCRQTGVGHAVALSSGTAALHLALLQAGVKPGDTVFCSTLSFVASANAITYCGAEPVFIDSERTSWNMDPQLLADALRQAAKAGRLPSAVEVVQAYGQCADMEAISALCAEWGVVLIEDAAEALGSTYRGKSAGTFGQSGVLSFNGNKLITTSGGGMLLTDDGALADRVRHLSTQAREPGREYLHHAVGYNYRLSNLLAAVGHAQLLELPAKIDRRRAIFETYRARLEPLPGISFMPEATYGTCTRWLTSFLIDEAVSGVGRDQVLNALEADNIEARPLWRPLHLQPIYRERYCHNSGVSEALFAQGISLPSSGNLTEEQQERVLFVIEACLRQRR